MDTPNYYAIIPANVRYDEVLSSSEKLLYGEITSLCSKEGFCWASNVYFSKLYGVDIRTVRRWIANLSYAGYIKEEVIRDENKAVVSRMIFITDTATKMSTPQDKNVPTPQDKNVPTPQDKNVLYNNTSRNNTSNNKEKCKKERFKKPTVEDISKYVKEECLDVDSSFFFDYYESKGWKVGNTPMKDWKCAVRNWARRNSKDGKLHQVQNKIDKPNQCPNCGEKRIYRNTQNGSWTCQSCYNSWR